MALLCILGGGIIKKKWGVVHTRQYRQEIQRIKEEKEEMEKREKKSSFEDYSTAASIVSGLEEETIKIKTKYIFFEVICPFQHEEIIRKEFKGGFHLPSCCF